MTREDSRTLVTLHPLGARQSHASTLLALPGGAFLIAWFAGSHEGATDTRIMLARGRPGAFAEPVIVADAPIPHWNPVLAHGPDSRVWLFFRRGPSIETWTTWVCHSADGGRTWDDAEPLVAEEHSRGPVRQAPVRHAGAWIAPGSVEIWSPAPRWDCFVDVTHDGRTWRRVDLPLDHAAVRGAGAIQPALLVGRDGQLIALARSSGGAVMRSCTADVTAWPPLEPCGLPNNNSGLAAVPLSDGRIVCVHNPATEDWGARCPLVASISSDDGHTWEPGITLEDGLRPLDGVRQTIAEATASDGAPPAAAATGVITSGEGEYSYPSAVIVDGTVWVSYTWQRRGIVLTRLPPLG
ncbi:MAG: exo-alpha-sialidase [Propioniciclava sp.]